MPAPISENAAKEAARKVLAIKPNGFAVRDGDYIYYCGKAEHAEEIIEAGKGPYQGEVFIDAVQAAKDALKANRAEAFSLPMGKDEVLFYGKPDDVPLIQFTLEE